MDINAKLAERARLINESREILAREEKEKRTLTAEENEHYDRLQREIDKIAETVQREIELQKREALAIAEQPTPEPAREARAEKKPLQRRETPEYQETFRRWLVGAPMGETELRALQADIDTAGGYLIPPVQFANAFIKALDYAVFVRQLATTYSVNSAQSLGAPSLDADPADPTWTTELLTGSADTTMAFGQRALTPAPLAQRILVSNTLLRQVPSAEALVQQRLAYKTAIVQENAFLNGSGANQPLGVFTASANGVSTARDVSTGNTDTSIKFDGLIEALYALKPQYRGRASWIFNTAAVKQIRKLKDGEGRYIWQGSVTMSEPDTILARPVYESQYAPSTFTTGLYVGILGDFSNYWIADSLSFGIQKLVELYAATNQVGYIVRAECDGMPVLAEAFSRVTLA